MKIVYLAAGAAGMYCGSCLHDNTLAAALVAAGQDVLLTPTYTPLRTDERDVSQKRIFFGGVNVYLQQKSAIFRHTPWFLDALLDSPALLNSLTRRAASTDPASLGPLTVSMLAGEHGRQRKELAKLTDWLARDARPDVVILSNALLLGMAREIRKLNIPVITNLSGEDLFLEQLNEPYYSQAKELLRERAAEADALVAMNRYYAGAMAEYLAVPRERIDVIRPGINTTDFGERPARRANEPFTIGYFARVCPEKGLHNLVAACELLDAEVGGQPFRLRVGGYLGQRDREYLAAIVARLKPWQEAGRFEYVGELDRLAKIAFLQSLDVLSVPTVYRESKGLSLVEGMAAGTPIVQPDHGVFRELIDDTAGGLVYPPDDLPGLASSLRRLQMDKTLRERLGAQGLLATHERYSAPAMARATLELCRRVVTGRGVVA